MDGQFDAGGCHWRSEQHVAGWDAIRSRLAPERAEGFRTLLGQLPADVTEFVDLGPDDVHDRTCASLAEATGFLCAGGYADVLVTARLPRPRRKGELTLVVGRRGQSSSGA
jgi:hypothetical protein